MVAYEAATWIDGGRDELVAIRWRRWQLQHKFGGLAEGEALIEEHCFIHAVEQ